MSFLRRISTGNIYFKKEGMVKNIIKKYLCNKCEYIKIFREYKNTIGDIRYQKFFNFAKPGHFYSPIPSIEDIINYKIKEIPKELPGIDLNIEEQLEFLKSFEKYYNEIPFHENKLNGLRYYFSNPNYTYSDAIFLYCMIRKLRPKRIIEVGSGYSSCVILDTNELFFKDKIQCFFNPFTDLLISLIKETDKSKINIISKNLQSIDVNFFKILSGNDILLIDSTHVSKFNSDVNYIIHRILPYLERGVYIHFHDIIYPFEYPQKWLLEGRAWNEQYLLRAFLEYNGVFKIVFFNTYLEFFYKDIFVKKFPLALKNLGGSLWIRKDK